MINEEARPGRDVLLTVVGLFGKPDGMCEGKEMSCVQKRRGTLFEDSVVDINGIATGIADIRTVAGKQCLRETQVQGTGDAEQRNCSFIVQETIPLIFGVGHGSA